MTSSSEPMPIADIAIIGTGIGGVSAAIALRQAGLSVGLYEQATALREVGGAIIVREPSVALLGRWGVFDRLRPKMVRIHDIELRDPAGRAKGTMPIQFVEGEGEYAYSVHRADVHMALLAAIPAEIIHLDHRTKTIEQKEDHATVAFENGQAVRARLVIGADGLKSIVRACLDDTGMTFAKMVTHRTIAPASLLPEGMANDRIRMWFADTLRVMILPIHDAVAIDAVIPAETPPETLWSSTSDEEILSCYAGFDPLIAKLIEGRTVDVTTHPVYDKDPIDRWVDGRIVLMGDAAHPMTPMQGQGANQAIQDAGALAAVLAGVVDDDRPQALDRYQSERMPVTARLQLASRRPPDVTIELAPENA